MGGVEAAHYHMNITLYNFAKERNSLDLPSGGTVRSCVLKEQSSITSPVVDMSGVDGLYNYAYIPSFDRYYYVTDIVKVTNDITRYSLAVDVLATYRSEILASSQYVLRSTNNVDVSIVDSWYPQKSGNKSTMKNLQFFDQEAEGTYILGVVGPSDGSITGAVQYVMMNAANLSKLMNFLFTDSNFADEITDDVVKTFFNPFQYVVDCMYFPFGWDTYGDNLRLGWFEPKDGDSPVRCKYLDTISWTGADITIDIPRPVSNAQDFHNYAPYADYRLYIPYFGWTDIDANLLKNDAQLELYFSVDFPTGTMMCEIVGKQSAMIITTLETQCAAKIPLAQVAYSQSINPGNIVSSVAKAGAWFASGMMEIIDPNDELGTAEIITGIGDGIANASKQVSTKGQMGCISQKQFEWRVMFVCNYFESVATDINKFGAPCCKTLTLSSLGSGFCQCMNPHVEISSALTGEVDQIESYLKGGVYL